MKSAGSGSLKNRNYLIFENYRGNYQGNYQENYRGQNEVKSPDWFEHLSMNRKSKTRCAPLSRGASAKMSSCHSPPKISLF
jgi:hypothetical protein